MHKVFSYLLDDLFGIRRMVDHAKRISEVERLGRDEISKLFSVCFIELDPVGKPKYLGPCFCNLKRFHRQIYGSYSSSRSGKIDRVRADPTPDLQDVFA